MNRDVLLRQSGRFTVQPMTTTGRPTIWFTIDTTRRRNAGVRTAECRYLSADEARDLAARLTAAADEVEGL